MRRNPRPRGFDENILLEEETQRILINCLQYDRIKIRFETIDRYPNRDGFIEILDEDLKPVGDIVIQVKKLPDESGEPPKKQIDSRTIAYGYTTNAPYVLIGVNTTNEVLYWKHASGKWLDSLNLGQADSKVVTFPQENKIDGEDPTQLEALERIAQNESQYLMVKESRERLLELVHLIYKVEGDGWFRGAELRTDVEQSRWGKSTDLTITPFTANRLAENTELLEKSALGGDAVAVVDTNAGYDERSVASINNTDGVRELAYQALHRESDDNLFGVTNWKIPSDVVSVVNRTIGRSVLELAIDSKYYRLTEQAISSIDS